MPVYVYEAEDQYGKTAAGLLDAASPAALRDLLSSRGFRLKSVQPQSAADSAVSMDSPTSLRSGPRTSSPAVNAATVSAGTVSAARNGGAFGPGTGAAGQPAGAALTAKPTAFAGPAMAARSGKRLSLKAQALLFREFAATFRAGITAFQACDMIGGRFQSGPLAELLHWTRDQTGQGASFADALESAPVRLDESNIGIIRAGERGGFLPLVLEELAASYEREYYLRGRMLLPKILYLWITLPLCFLAWPLGNFANGAVTAAFGNTGKNTTPLAAGGGQYAWALVHQSIPAGIAVLALYVLWKWWSVTTASGRRFADAVGLRIPLWGSMQRGIGISRFARILGNLYRGGVPLRESWRLASDAIPNAVLAGRLRAQEGIIAASQPISHALQASRLFGPAEIGMVATGEQTGETDAMLFRLAAYLEDVADRNGRMLPLVVHILLALALVPFVALVVGRFFLTYYHTLFQTLDQ